MGEETTIFAVSSGAGKAGVAIIRVSGPACTRVLEHMAGGLPKPRYAALRSIRDRNGETIDRGLVLWFPGPGSFTGEDCVEFHVHGGRAVVRAVLEALAQVPGCRPAEAGDFARRAFDNGKIDLTEVEGLADLIDSETEWQRRQACRQMEGHSGRVYEDWRHRLIGLIGLCEAGIDFADEDDVPADIALKAAPDLAALIGEVRDVLDDDHRGERIREGLVVVIAGPPNAGKSSLINALAMRDIAIVSERPGTTRDVLEARLDIGGVPVTVVDTAGLRESEDEIERIGVDRARGRIESADLVLWLAEEGTDSEAERMEGSGHWCIRTKIDLSPSTASGRTADGRWAISAKTGAGMDALLDGLRKFVEETVAGEMALITRMRHRIELQNAVGYMEAASRLDYIADSELVAEDLRLAGQCLARLTGRIDVEDILDVIFRDFCIGK